MAKYLALIRRSDFTDLFKYGRIFLNQISVTKVTKDSHQTKDNDSQLAVLFKNANPFESSFTYLVIEFESTAFSNDSPSVDIEEVTHVYPLDKEAKKEFETSFDTHIRIEEPVWKDAYAHVQRIRTKRDCEKGADNVCRLFGLSKSVGFCKDIFEESSLDEIVSEVYSNKRPSGKLPVWVYLLRYERHSFFPQETVGFFMDAVYVICNFLNQQEVYEDEVNNTDILRFLERLPREKKMKDIFAALNDSETAKPFLEMVKKIDDRVDFLQVAVLYLILKHRYSDGLRYEKEMIARFVSNDSPNKSFIFAAYLVGIVLGHDKTYEALYENLPLRIYKSPEEMQRLKRQQEYERLQAAEEMRRMEEEQRRERENWQRRRKNKTDIKESPKYRGREPYYRGLNPDSFLAQSETPVQKPISKIEVHNPIKNVVQLESPTMHETLFPDFESPNTDLSIPKFPCMMGQLKKGSITEFRKNRKPKKVENEDEYMTLYNSGWRIIND